MHKIGARVHFITDVESTGTVRSEPSPSPVGGLRQEVLWDRSGEITAWSPKFLIPIGQQIPERAEAGSGLVYVKSLNALCRDGEVVYPKEMKVTLMDGGITRITVAKAGAER